MLKNGVAIQRPRHHWVSGLRPEEGRLTPTDNADTQSQVTHGSTPSASAGFGADKIVARRGILFTVARLAGRVNESIFCLCSAQ